LICPEREGEKEHLGGSRTGWKRGKNFVRKKIDLTKKKRPPSLQGAGQETTPFKKGTGEGEGKAGIVFSASGKEDPQIRMQNKPA